MSDKLPDSALSAFHDGEGPPAERQAVEGQLAESADARHELADYRRLSELLGELPREALPPEFASAVMQRVERQMLLAAAPAAPARSRVRLPGIVALLATAAVALVLVWPRTPAGRNGAPELVLESAPPPPSAEPSAEAFDQFGDPLVAFNKSNMEQERLAAASSANGVFEKANRRPDGTSVDLDGLIMPGNLQDFEVGQFVDALQTGAGQVTVVKLLVVDRQAGLKTLQVLLARHQVNVDQPAVPEEVLEESAVQQDDQFVAVYVEATNQQLASTLGDLFEQETFRGMQVEPSVELAETDRQSLSELTRAVDESLQRQQLAARRESGASVGREAGAAARGRLPDAAAPAASLPAPPAPAAAVAKSIDDKPSDEQQLSDPLNRGSAAAGDKDFKNEERFLSRQVVVVMPESVGRDANSSRLRELREPAGGDVPRHLQQRPLAGKPQERKRLVADNRPVHVIFVLEETGEASIP